MGYHSLVYCVRPIEPILDCTVTPHNPGQTTNPTTSHIMYVPNLPKSSAPRTQPSIPVLSLPSSARGKPPARPMLSGTRIVPNQGQNSNIEQSTIYVPPTHTNMANPPSISGHLLGAQPVDHSIF